MITIIATICLIGTSVCHDVPITNSDIEGLGMATCAVGEPAIVEWLTRAHPGYALAIWRCEMGSRAKRDI